MIEWEIVRRVFSITVCVSYYVFSKLVGLTYR